MKTNNKNSWAPILMVALTWMTLAVNTLSPGVALAESASAIDRSATQSLIYPLQEHAGR